MIAAIYEIISSQLSEQFETVTKLLSKNFEDRSAPAAEGEDASDKWEGVND